MLLLHNQTLSYFATPLTQVCLMQDTDLLLIGDLRVLVLRQLPEPL